jgi:diaminohydroxyphosphoribosylaminopyrimidine deaminase/5-amino-6-(5-phosphoribosylamino)uracil reductase
MDVLYQEKLQSLMVEGGSILLQSFIDSNHWDEAFIECSDAFLTEGVQAPIFPSHCNFSASKKFGKTIKYAFNKTSEQEKTTK